MAIYKLHSIKIHIDGGSAIIIGDMLDVDEPLNLKVTKEVTAPNTVPTHVAHVGRDPLVRGSTYDLKGMLDAIGVAGLGIAGATNPGVVVYYQKFDDMGFAVSGSNHLSKTYANGVLVPKSITCDHQGDAKLTFELVVIGDGTNAPVILATTAALPTITQVPNRWTLGPVKLGNLAFSEYAQFELDFGNNVQTRGVASNLDATHIEQKTHEPKFTLSGINPLWFGSSFVPIGGLVVANSTDSIYLRKRTQTAASWVADITAEHFKFTLAGLAGVGKIGGQAQRASESSIEVNLVKDASGNAPLVMSTASAIT